MKNITAHNYEYKFYGVISKSVGTFMTVENPGFLYKIRELRIWPYDGSEIGYRVFAGDFRGSNAGYSFHGGKLLWSLVQITS